MRAPSPHISTVIQALVITTNAHCRFGPVTRRVFSMFPPPPSSTILSAGPFLSLQACQRQLSMSSGLHHVTIMARVAVRLLKECVCERLCRKSRICVFSEFLFAGFKAQRRCLCCTLEVGLVASSASALLEIVALEEDRALASQ